MGNSTCRQMGRAAAVALAVATSLAAGPARAQFRSLGGTATGAPRAGYDYSEQDSDGRLFLFVRGLDYAVWYRSRSEIASNWTDWKSLGGYILSNVSLGSVNGRVAAFARGGENALWYTVRQGDGFTPWMSLGGILTSDPVVEVVGGRPRVFVRGADGALWYRAQMQTGQWLGWRSLGGGIDGAPSVTQGSDGQLVILAQHEGILWQRRDPEFEAGIDPAQLWTPIGFDNDGRYLYERMSDPVLAPGCSASSPVFLWGDWTFVKCGHLRHFGDGSALWTKDVWVGGSAIVSKIAVTRRPGGGFYLATRRYGDQISVMTAELDDQFGLRIAAVQSASNVTGLDAWAIYGFADLSVVADSREGRPVIFSLNASRAVEERWF